MDCFLKRIFEGTTDELIHLQFQKFSRGTFNHRGLIRATHTAKGFSVVTDAEYANDLVRTVAELLGTHKASVTGVIVSTQDLKGKIPSISLKQFMGIKQYGIGGEMSGHEILALMKSFPDAFFALTFNAGDTTLKIKAKAPKSAKPKTSEAPPKPDFCTLKTMNATLVASFVFNAPSEWKTFEAQHAYIIDDIEIPSHTTNPIEMRRLAKRKGTIVRKAMINGNEHVSEKKFVA